MIYKTSNIDPFEEYEDLWAALCTVPAKSLRQKASEYAFMVEDQPWWRRLLLRLQHVDVPEIGSVSPFAAAEWYEGALKRTVKTSLQLGELLAFGFQSPRTADAVRRPVPPDMWEGEIDFENSSVRLGTLAFEGIRAVRKDEFTPHEAVELPLNPVSDTSKPVGRPSMRQAIRKAYVATLGAGHIDFAQSLRSNIKAIRATFQKMFPDLVKGKDSPDYETIRREVGGMFNAEKASRKTSSKL